MRLLNNKCCAIVIVDLALKFDTQEIITALGAVQNGDIRVLTLTGELMDGTAIEGSDCVVIKGEKNK